MNTPETIVDNNGKLWKLTSKNLEDFDDYEIVSDAPEFIIPVNRTQRLIATKDGQFYDTLNLEIIQTGIKVKQIICYTKERIDNAYLVLDVNHDMYLVTLPRAQNNLVMKFIRSNVHQLFDTYYVYMSDKIFVLIDDKIYSISSTQICKIFTGGASSEDSWFDEYIMSLSPDTEINKLPFFIQNKVYVNIILK